VSEFVANAIAGNRAISFISLAMVVLAVMIPVWSLLHILVLHERRPIAILGALGFERRAIFQIYLFKAALIGLVGVALGVGVGLVLCELFRAYPIFAHSGFVVRPELSLWGVLVPSAVLFGVTLLAGLIPAFLAARCNPSLELREE
jgi:ABC-type lipoprotein release transport system permease subunit